ncbi:TylF/MycF/NovP-related O-methyltransferase [Methylocapsa sp. S129]|uniref:TylF/MycF/NovP-related O-methyltransferase n=1 Tax=Methylocapsa sp. S129 TaxID=1641869 RepID=UPI00131DCF6D|nr:TylF/MycF/NovP-related O-methyltransferase [Methylocapsa sp. S129]
MTRSLFARAANRATAVFNRTAVNPFALPFDDKKKRVFLERLADPKTRAAFTDFFVREILAHDHHSIFWGDRLLTIDKAMGFFEDPAFAKAWESVRGAHEYDQYDNRQSIAWRMHTLVWAARQALQLPEGDFVECGVFQGDMSFVVYQAAGIAGSGRRMHLFDSFDGIDPARAADGEYGRSSNYIAESNVHYQRPGLYESVRDRFASMPEVSVHKGFLPEALQGRTPEKIAWLHIDLNAAIPEVETLGVLFDRVVPSGAVILDDYGWLVLRGQKDAEDAFFAKRGYTVLELPTGQGLVIKRPESDRTFVGFRHEETASADLKPTLLVEYADVFSGIAPWSGRLAGGYSADFLGIKTDHKFLPLTNFPPEDKIERDVRTRLPRIEDGELWFEAANWVEAARDARDRFVMITLGANYGAQAVGACMALRALNPMPCKLVAVEPVPENLAWTQQHMRDNGVNPADHWLVSSAIGGNSEPVLFPIGSPGSGSQNSFATNEKAARENYARELTQWGRSKPALRSLLLHNTTGLITNLVSGHDLPAEIKLVSCVTLRDIVAPFDIVDYIESDIQQSEILVFPPAIDFLKTKVRRIHIGTHGAEVHAELRRLFLQGGWELVFDFAPNSRFETALGSFETNDGVLTVRNPSLATRRK